METSLEKYIEMFIYKTLILVNVCKLIMYYGTQTYQLRVIKYVQI